MCVCVQGCLGGGPPYLSEARHGSRYLFLISPALCGFPAVTGLRVETGTNEQLHPACLPGIMGLQTDRASVCALFSALSFCHSLASRVRLISTFSHSVVQLSFPHFFFPLDSNLFSIFNSPYSYHVISFIISFSLSPLFEPFPPLTSWLPRIVKGTPSLTAEE